MTVLYVVSDQSQHVSRLSNQVSLQPIVDFNMTNFKIKHPNQKMMKSNLLAKYFLTHD